MSMTNCSTIEEAVGPVSSESPSTTERQQPYEETVTLLVDVVERYRLHNSKRLAAGLTAGHLLRQARAQVQHGDWENLLTRVGWTPRTAQRWMRLAEANLLASTITHFGGLNATLTILGKRVDLFKDYDGRATASRSKSDEDAACWCQEPCRDYLGAIGRGMVVQARVEAEVGLMPEASFKDEHVAVFWRIVNLLGDDDTEERPHIYGQMRHRVVFDQAGG